MSNELQIFETEELTTTEKTELGRNIDRLIYTHKNNRQEINRLVFASVAAMTDADRDQADLSRKGLLNRWIGGISGSNQRLQNAINKNRAVSQYASQQILKKLAEQNLMTFDLITAVNNKLNASLTSINEEFANIYDGLRKFFRYEQKELVSLEARLAKVERNVNVLTWQTTVEYKDLNGTEYVDLDSISKIVCLARDFYEVTGGKWTTSDLLILKAAMSLLEIQPREKVNYFETVTEIANNPALKEKFLGGGELLPVREPGYLITMSALSKMDAYQNEEKHNVTAFADLLKENGIVLSPDKIRANLTKKYLKEEAFVNADIDVESYDLAVDLLYNLKEAKDEGLLVHEKTDPTQIFEEALKCEKTKEYEKAFELYQQAASLGSADAVAKLGCFYIYDKFVNVVKWDKGNYDKGIAFFKKAAEQGSAMGQYELAMCYKNDAKWKESLELLYKAAEQGYGDAQDRLGYIFSSDPESHSFGIKKNCDKAIEWFTKAAMQGNTSALKHLGEMYEEGYSNVSLWEIDISSDDTSREDDEKRTRNPYKAFEWYYKAAELGDKEAQVKVGDMYYDGRGVIQNISKAAEWYQKVAEIPIARDYSDFETISNLRECITAHVKLGNMYLKGEGVFKDYNKAFSLFNKAAELDEDDSTVKVIIANMYHYGWGVTQNYEKAYELYKKVIDSDELESGCVDPDIREATYQLGVMYENGEGVKQDATEAVRLYTDVYELRAFDKEGEPGVEACYRLGMMYYYGKGVEQDYNKAFDYFMTTVWPARSKKGRKAISELFVDGDERLKKLDDMLG